MKRVFVIAALLAGFLQTGNACDYTFRVREAVKQQTFYSWLRETAPYSFSKCSRPACPGCGHFFFPHTHQEFREPTWENCVLDYQPSDPNFSTYRYRLYNSQFQRGAVFCRMEAYTQRRFGVMFSVHAGGYK